jgi:hypothetical protein
MGRPVVRVVAPEVRPIPVDTVGRPSLTPALVEHPPARILGVIAVHPTKATEGDAAVFNIVEPEVPAGWSAVPHNEPVVADEHIPIPEARTWSSARQLCLSHAAAA